jgi:hypothetical protein
VCARVERCVFVSTPLKSRAAWWETSKTFPNCRHHCVAVYTHSLAVIPSSEIKIWRENYQGEISLNDPTKQGDKPALPYALTLTAMKRLAATYRARHSIKEPDAPAIQRGACHFISFPVRQ